MLKSEPLVGKGVIYNENDPAACAWLRELIANDLIAPGDVDERSIKDVRADDYRGYTQVHAFSGIGIWSAALRAAGWDDARPVGTASVPCQPFSGAGKGLGFDDPRHLWPDYRRLVDEANEQGQPWARTLFGEQVATAGLWLDLVRLDLEDRGYAFWATDLPAAGFAQGAHIRQRLDWVADRDNAERWADLAGGHIGDWPQTGRIEGYGEPGAGRAVGRLADAAGRQSGDRKLQPSRQHGLQPEDGGVGRLEHPHVQHQRSANDGTRTGDVTRSGKTDRLGHHHPGPPLGSFCPDERGAVRVEGPAAGAAGSLRGCDWLLCHDARIRPVEAGTFPLAASHPGRLGLLRGYGNALDFEQTTQFIAAYMEALEDRDVMAEFA